MFCTFSFPILHLFPHFSTGLSWSPVTEAEQKYLVLDNEPFMARTQDYVTKMDFWQQIFPCWSIFSSTLTSNPPVNTHSRLSQVFLPTSISKKNSKQLFQPVQAIITQVTAACKTIQPLQWENKILNFEILEPKLLGQDIWFHSTEFKRLLGNIWKGTSWTRTKWTPAVWYRIRFRVCVVCGSLKMRFCQGSCQGCLRCFCESLHSD